MRTMTARKSKIIIYNNKSRYIYSSLLCTKFFVIKTFFSHVCTNDNMIFKRSNYKRFRVNTMCYTAYGILVTIYHKTNNAEL